MDASVLVAHPGRQHSHQLARALLEEGALAEYWTGVPSAPPLGKGALYRLLARMSPQSTLDLPADQIRHWYVAPLVRRLAETVSHPSQVVAWQHRAMGWFDRWCAWQLPTNLDAVVCYENAALHIFRKAHKQGATTILDAASFHHEWQDQMYDPVESEEAHARITRRKDEEIRLADHLLTVSELARESYLDAGVPPETVTSVPMGTDLSHFTPMTSPPDSTQRPFTFLLVGHADRRKGADVLNEASHILQAQNIGHRVEVAGHVDESIRAEAPSTVEFLGYLDHEALNRAFARADVLVLPSRFDSFGRVVVEAMGAGLPVIISEHVGAKEVVTEGNNGWIVPAEDAERLAEQMKWCIQHPEHVSSMQEAAVAAAQNYTWETYRDHVIDVLQTVIRREEAAV